MKPTLVVMAAGVGSRYGGLKQIEPVGQSGEIILDYSVFDAIQAGFGKVIFIIRHDIENDFKAVIGSHFTDRIPIEYVFQELSDLPAGFSTPSDRTKPWGTGHAVLECKDIVKEPFAVINADDFYGKHSYEIISDFLQNVSPDDNTCAMAGYKLMNTLSDYGHVARGICEVDANHILISVKERLKIEKTKNGARYLDESEQWVNAKGNEIVSMNMFGFTPALFTWLEQLFPVFLSGILEKEALIKTKAEFLIPSVVDQLIREKKITMKVLETHGKWFGVTYQKDKAEVIANIRKQVKDGIYPKRLWD